MVGMSVCTLTAHFIPASVLISCREWWRIPHQVWSSTGHDCNGKWIGNCICTDDSFPRTAIVNPGCPVSGHSGSVTRVRFSDDGAQVISCSDDDTVRFWDFDHDVQVRELAGSILTFVEGPSDQRKSDRYILTACGDMLLIYNGVKEEQDPDDLVKSIPVACFKAPREIISVGCHGASIFVGCDGGAVCVLSASFLAA